MQFLPMAEKSPKSKEKDFNIGSTVVLADLVNEESSNEVCCGGPPPPRSNPLERPGYTLQHYVHGFVISEDSDVALVKTRLEWRDHIGTLRARLGFKRDFYRVAPGLYGVGNPIEESPVIVTANYKLTFDHVRSELESIDCWLLVLDTCGINVWCAAGKQTFSTAELLRMIEHTNLKERVNHRKIIVPQLGATGVAAHEIKLKSGFRVVYGPVRATDIRQFLKDDMRATQQMRAVTFTLYERFVLIPVEFYLFSRKIWWIFPVLFVLSGIGLSWFSLDQAIQRGLLGSIGIISGGVLGALVTPLLLPWIPGRSFALKGLISGIIGGCLFLAILEGTDVLDKISLLLGITAISSYLAMNFTGSTPYTSPTGVEKEMKIAIPCQLLATALSVILWMLGPFV